MPIIIAEAGVNHNGSLQTALQLVDAAAAAGADYVKFQTFRAKNLVTLNAETADYQKANCNAQSQLDMLRQLELSQEDFVKIAGHCKEKGIGFLSTPFDLESIEFLETLDMDYMKIPSGEITNLPYLKRIALTCKPIIMSTGMSDLLEIGRALDVFYAVGYREPDITLLHCNTEYPTPYSDVNLLAMVSMHECFGVYVGYSDHTRGITVPIAATALGATMIEKHFTLSRTMPGPDHAASLEPHELKEMCAAIRQADAALGSRMKVPSPSEQKNRSVARKSIVASKAIKKGEYFTERNLAAKRPGTGISPMFWEALTGTPATRDYLPDQMIEEPGYPLQS